VACLESFLESNGILRPQQDIIDKHHDLCKVVKDAGGKLLEGVIPFGKEEELFEREGVLSTLVGSITNIADLDRMHAAFQNLNSNESFVIGITHHNDQFHAVLFDSLNYHFDVWVMDPDSGYKRLNKDYTEIVKLEFHRISFHPRSVQP
jgi:hypothetical protein